MGPTDMMLENWLPQIDATICTGCGDCIPACPTGTLALVEGLAVTARPQACNYCGVCEEVCPVEAIALPYLILMQPEG